MLLEDLKVHTRPRHSRLEAINGLPRALPDYVALLGRFHGFVAPWERRLAERLPDSDVLRAGRAKTGWLEADLAHFGLDAAGVAALPRCERLPAGGTRAELLGACYVLEGSTLGGPVVARHLHERLGVQPGAGDRYFRGYGAEVGERWRAFREELLRHSSPETDREIIGAAQDTFDKLAAWFAARPEPAAA